MSKKKGQRRVRVDFRANRATRARSDEWTRRFQAGEDEVVDAARVESVRPKGELSRRRTVIEDDDRLTAGDESAWRRGVVTVVHGLICYVDDDDGTRWACTVRRVLRTRLIDARSPVTVGDRVRFSDQSKAADGEPVGVIERVEDRRSTLSRADRRGRAHTIVANADCLLIVASVAQPALKPHLIDRYIVAAVKGGLSPIVCMNKIDLLDTHPLADADLEELAEPGAQQFRMPRPTVDSVTAELRALGYCVLHVSAATGAGIDSLREALKGHTTVLSGQSGVGKSSLLNAVQPGLALATGHVSHENEKGRHTTTHARLIRLDFGGYVVDTPGVRSFELWDVPPNELEACFVEFAPYLQHCRFRDCLHFDEVGCAVRLAAEESRISPRRYLSYRKMYQDAAAPARGKRS
jgi:ribosome biogenesis GTPase